MYGVELRWVIKNEERVLQYRQKYDKTIYAGLGPHGDFPKEMVWSEWMNVPEIYQP